MNLSKNPVNLSIFSEIQSWFDRTVRNPIPARSQACVMTANADNCVVKNRPGRDKPVRWREVPGEARACVA